MYLKNCFLISIIVLQIFFCSQRTLFGKEIDPKVALGVMTSLEKENTLFRWRGTGLFGSLRKDLNYTRSYDFQILFDLSQKHYFAKIRYKAESVCRNAIFSFDGKQYTMLEEVGACEGDISITNGGWGTISNEVKLSSPHDQYFRNSGTSSIGTPAIGITSGMPGICDFMPVPSPKLLSEYLEEWIKNKQLISITEKEEGIWVIVSKVTIWTVQGINKPRNQIEIHYDVGKGGLITKQRTIAKQFNLFTQQVKEIEVGAWEVEPRLNSKNQWVPKSISQTNQSNLSYFKIDFEEFEINPPLEKDSFQVSFPKGVYVDDFITKKRYRMGDVVNDDLALQAFMRSNGLADDLRGEVPKKLRRGNTIRYILMGVGVLLIGIALFQMVQKRRKG